MLPQTHRKAANIWRVALVLAGALVLPASFAAAPNASPLPAPPAAQTNPSCSPLLAASSLLVRLDGKQYDLARPGVLDELAAAAGNLAQAADAQEAQRRQARETLRAGRPLASLTQKELVAYYYEPQEFLLKKDRRGFQELQRLADLARTAQTPADRQEWLRQAAEVAAAIENNRRYPAPRKVDFLLLPPVFLDYLHNPIGHGQTSAANLSLPVNCASDLSLADPLPSSFWARPQAIASLDLSRGFGRDRLLSLGETIWDYDQPKTGFGGNAGIAVRSDAPRHKLKVKFGETRSEPFAARVFWALGYHVQPTDFSPALKVRYDRRLLREFHQHKPLGSTITLLGFIPLYRHDAQQWFDPFDFIAAAVLKDGTRLTSAELKLRLLRDPVRRHAAYYPDNYQAGFEPLIDYLVTRPANVQVEDASVAVIGRWDFGQLDHAHRRELRGLAVLAAWLGWYDTRFDNTRLAACREPQGTVFKHYLADVGGGLGHASGLTGRHGEDVAAFPWTFTLPPRFQGRGRMTIPFKITGYNLVEDNPAFEQMTLDDARWMARLMAQLTETQISQALTASGFEPADVRLFTDKLLSRRARLLRDLGLPAVEPSAGVMEARP